MPPWTHEWMLRAIKRFVAEGLAEPELLDPAAGKERTDAARSENLVAMVAGMKQHEPNITIREIAQRVERMRQRTPRGCLD